MSGGGGTNGYFPSPRTTFDCETSKITTSIAALDFVVLSHLLVGDILDVSLSNDDTVVLETINGEILGSIIHANVIELIKCIKQGNQYDATIISIKPMQCNVTISRR